MGFTFTKPISLTIEYTYADVAGIDEDQLDVRYYDAQNQQWSSDGIVIIERDLAQNRIIATITHLTEFGLWGTSIVASEKLYLPLVARESLLSLHEARCDAFLSEDIV